MPVRAINCPNCGGTIPKEHGKEFNCCYCHSLLRFEDDQLLNYVTPPAEWPAEATLPTLREIFNKHFSISALNDFCKKHYPEIYGEFSSGMSKMERLNLLLNRCRLSGVLETLLENVKIWFQTTDNQLTGV